MSLFCRHNRFTADCPICSKTEAAAPVRRAKPAKRGGGRSPRPASGSAPMVRGPYSSAGPYEHDGARYEVRLERVPGGLRLAEWSGGQLRRRAPVLAAADVQVLLAGAAEQGLLEEGHLTRIASGGGRGVSAGRAGELKEELRAEQLDDGRVRVGRWIFRPGPREWELQESPTIMPAARYAEALAGLSGLVPS